MQCGLGDPAVLICGAVPRHWGCVVVAMMTMMLDTFNRPGLEEALSRQSHPLATRIHW
jgi:hypothetical protein